jgi:hypothetical protein
MPLKKGKYKKVFSDWRAKRGAPEPSEAKYKKGLAELTKFWEKAKEENAIKCIMKGKKIAALKD